MWRLPRVDPGGSTNILISATLFLLFFYNVTNQIIGQKDFIERLPYTLPFIVLAILAYIIKSKKFLSFIYLFIAVFTTINTPNISDYSGVLGFIIAFDLIKKNKYGIFLITIMAISLTTRLVISNETIPRSLAMVMIFSFWSISYYTVIYRNYPKPIKARIKQLSEEENKLLQLMCAGHSQQEAGRELGHKYKQVTNFMINDIREKLNVDKSEATYKLIYLYTLYGK
jgi:DNA-binding CsgD family transcriptional regulator